MRAYLVNSEQIYTELAEKYHKLSENNRNRSAGE